MKRICISSLIFLFISLSVSVQALCSDLYQEANALINEGQYDNVIELLSGPCSLDPLNFKLNILLATAQVEKCALLKQTGDDTYKTLIMQPYRTAVRLHNVIGAHPELYYLSAKSLWINNSRHRAKKTISKALKLDANNIRYLLLKGDICYYMGNHESDVTFIDSAFNDAKNSYQKALVLELDPAKKQDIEARLAEIPKQRATRLRNLGKSDY